MENISLSRRLEYNKYRRKTKTRTKTNKQTKNGELSKEVFPISALGIFGSVGEGSFCLEYALK